MKGKIGRRYRETIRLHFFVFFSQQGKEHG